MLYPALLSLMRTPRLPAVDWTDAPTDLNAVGIQYPSHYLGTWCIQHYYRWCAHLGCQLSTELTPPAELNGLVRFAERLNLISKRVQSYFNWPLSHQLSVQLFTTSYQSVIYWHSLLHTLQCYRIENLHNAALSVNPLRLSNFNSLDFNHYPFLTCIYIT